jgi:twinkle protein
MTPVTPIREEQATFSDFGIDTGGKRGQIKTLCPKCSHRRHKSREKCLSVNTEEGVWNCKNDDCEFAGSLHSGLDEGHRPFRKPYKPKVYAVPMIRKPDGQSESTLNVDAIKMLKARGIDPKVAIEAGVFATTHWFSTLDREAPALCFPFTRNGQIVNAKYRPIDPTGFDPDLKTFAQESNAEPTWYGLDWCKDQPVVIIVEGEFDALAFRQAGFDAVLSVLSGSPSTLTKEYSSKFEFFPSGEKILEEATCVYIAIEADKAGNIMAEELARRIGKEKCFRTKFPEDCKDANDTLIHHGKAALERVISQSINFPYAGITSALELRDRVLHLKEHGIPEGFGCGLPSLDRIFRAVPGQMGFAVGVPTHGKTTVIDTIMLGWAIRNDWVVGIFTPEQYPQEMYIINLLQKAKRKPIEAFSPTELDQGMEWLDRHVKIVQPDHPTISEIEERMDFLVRRDGARALIVDPWTEVAFESGFGTENDFVKAKLTGFRQNARDKDFYLHVNAHPRKMTEQKDTSDGQTRTDKPSAYDIMGSSHFANKGDVIMSIWRDTLVDESPIEVSVVKARHRRNAQRGTILLNYHPEGEYLTDGGSADQNPYYQ